MPKIKEMFAFVMADKGPEDEGVMGMNDGQSWLPFVGADMQRVKQLRPFADQISKAVGKPYKVLHFTKVEEIK